MKLCHTIFILSIALITLTGCQNSKDSTKSDPPKETHVTAYSSYGNKTVTSSRDFSNMYEDWASRLNGLAGTTEETYDNWINGKLKTDDLYKKMEQIYADMKQLKRESDLKTEFNLNEEDKKQVNYDAVVEAYNKASKDLNDFLYMTYTLQLPDDRIKSKYSDLINKDYNENYGKLKTLLSRDK